MRVRCLISAAVSVVQDILVFLLGEQVIEEGTGLGRPYCISSAVKEVVIWGAGSRDA